MTLAIDWLAMWRGLVTRREWRFQDTESDERHDHWRDRAQEFDSHVRERWTKPDSSRDFILSRIDGNPGSTILDIGAGTGKWAILLAAHAKHVTALEPSPAMLDMLRANLVDKQIANVTVVPDRWPQASVEIHDFTLCSHAMYGFADFEMFVRRMEAVTRHTCFLLMRIPILDSIMAEASTHLWGHPHDSANAIVALNALWQMGIFPNVLMEGSGLWKPWVNASLEDALSDIKRRLGVSEIQTHDDYLMDLLRRRLKVIDGQYVWDRGVQTAMIYWQPPKKQSA